MAVYRPVTWEVVERDSERAKENSEHHSLSLLAAHSQMGKQRDRRRRKLFYLNGIRSRNGVILSLSRQQTVAKHRDSLSGEQALGKTLMVCLYIHLLSQELSCHQLGDLGNTNVLSESSVGI